MKTAFYTVAAIGTILLLGLLVKLFVGAAIWTWPLIFLFILIVITLYCLRRTGAIKQHESVMDALRRFIAYLKEP
jgi:hypothetical protein